MSQVSVIVINTKISGGGGTGATGDFHADAGDGKPIIMFLHKFFYYFNKNDRGTERKGGMSGYQ